MKLSPVLLVAALPASPTFAQCELQRVEASDGTILAEFGHDVAISGFRALVGARYHPLAAFDAGAAYVFELHGTTWTETSILVGGDTAASDVFASSVALDGTRALVGAPGDDDAGSSSGSAYVFELVGGAWVETAKLAASDAAAGDAFGSAVSLDGDRAVIGAPQDDDGGDRTGSCYVFEKQGAMWVQVAKLNASDAAPMDEFGNDVSVFGTRVLVGAALDDDAGDSSGGAYLFENLGAGWVEAAKLTASDAAAGDVFGTSVSLYGARCLVGAPGHDEVQFGSGAAYVFENAGAGWVETAKLIQSHLDSGDQFGHSVHLRPDRAAVGAPHDEGPASLAGAAYVFDHSAGSWTESARLTGTLVGPFDVLGWSVAVEGETLLTGVPGDDDLGTEAGVAYFFTTRGCPPGAATCLGTGCPCGNDDPSAGCANSTGMGGLLTGSGTASAAADDLVLLASRLPRGNSGLFYMGDALVSNTFFDGRQCALGTTWRFLCCIQTATVAGTMTLGPGVAASSGGLITPGSTWHFHAWHRDVPGTPCGTGANVTNVYSVTFGP